jgi:zinc protease
MAAIALPRIERTNIDGVPVLWSEAPGLVTTALQFRVGRADERASEAGITHVVEHLAMVPLGQPRYDHNAFVEPVRTVFFATGTERDLVGFFETVGTTLQALPLDRLDMERAILKRESEGRGSSIVEAHRHYRFGLTAHGLAAQPEFGLGTVSAERISAWAGTAFGARNAGAWMTAPPPAGLRFPLVEGGRVEPQPPEPHREIPWPAHLAPDVPGVGLGFLLPRTRGAGTFVSILHRRLRQRLRLDRGLVYDVVADYEPLDSAFAVAVAGAECGPEHTQQVADLVIGELDALARGEATAEELAEELADLERDLADPLAVAGLLDMMVRDELLGMPERSPADRHEEQRATSPEDIAARASEARASALLLADIDPRPLGFSAYPLTSDRPVAGREVKPFLSVLGLGPKIRLFIGPDGVSLRAKDGTVATVLYADCVVLERPADDELVMWGREGARVYVPEAFWRSGDQVIAEIEAALPSDIVIRDKVSDDLID